MATTTPRLRTAPALLLSTALATIFASCGGGGGGGAAGDAELAFRVNWQQPDSSDPALLASPESDALETFDTPIPPSVSAIRFILRPASPAPPCCIAVLRGSQAFADRRIVLANVAAGLGSLEVYGFPTNFAPSDGVGAACATNPAGQGVPCSGAQNTLPSFGSDEIPVDVLSGERNFVSVDVYSLPFLLDLNPGDGETVESNPPTVNFTVVDANHSVGSNVNIRLRSGAVTTQASIEGSEVCDDGDTSGETPECSEGGGLEVQGRIISAVSPQVLPGGIAELRIRASNTDSPPHDMESNTTFIIPSESTTTTIPSTTTTVDSTTTTTTESTTTTLGVPETFCLQFSVSNAVDLVGISYTANYAATGGTLVGSGENASCTSLLPADENTLASFNDDDGVSTLSSAIISAQTFAGPVPLARCVFEQVPPLNLGQFVLDVTEATAPDLSPANATVVVEETPCPL